MHEELASDLKAQREASGLTLQDVFDRTRINVHFLEAMEAGQFDVLPEVYIRLFLRKVAEEIGLDPEDVIRRWEAPYASSLAAGSRGRKRAAASSTPPKADAAAPVSKAVESPSEETGAKPDPAESSDASAEASPDQGTPAAPSLSRDRDSGNRTGLILGVAAVLALAVAAFVSSRSGSSPAGTSNAGSNRAPAAADRVDTGERIRAYSIQLPSADADSLVLQVSVTGRTRLVLTQDGQLAFERSVSTGDNFSWKARRRFLLEVDRSDAVQIVLQDSPLHLNARPDSRLKLFISPASVWVEESVPGSAAAR